MTDKFEEWLEEQVKLCKNRKQFWHPDGCANPANLLRKYREFLKEQPASALHQSNHTIGCELEAVANVLDFRGLTDEAETLRVIAARLK